MAVSTHQQPNGAASQAQQAAFLQNAQIPGMDMSALNGISPAQLALIGQLFQSGALNLPQIPVPPQPTAAAPAGASIALDSAQAPAPADNALSQQEDAEMDKEEGELEEGEELDAGREREFLRPPPTGPRKRSASPRDQYGRTDRRTSFQGQRTAENPAKARKVSEQRFNGQLGKQDASSSISHRITTNGQPGGRRMVDTGSAARKFVLQMHNAGYSFEQLAKEVPNHKALRSMYKALSLPLPSESVIPPVAQMDGTVLSPLPDPRTNGIAATIKHPMAVVERKLSATIKPAPTKPAPPANREEYLARLAKLKTKPTASAVPPPTSKAVPPPSLKAVEQTTAVPIDTVAKQQSATLPTAVAATNKPAAFKSVVKTDLVKERLAKLKAEQAAKLAAAQSPSHVPVVSSPLAKPASSSASSVPPATGFAASNGLNAGVGEIAARVTSSTQLPAAGPTTAMPAQAFQHVPAPLQTSLSSAPTTPSRPFSALPGLFRLPGLFMGGTPAQPSPMLQQVNIPLPSPTAKQMQSPVVPIKAKTVSADTNVSATSPVSSPVPLSVARRRSVAPDFDNDVPASTALSVPTRTVFGQSRNNSESLIILVSDGEDEGDENPKSPKPVGNLPDFPPKPSLSSAPGTPGGATPGSAAEYSERMKANQMAMEELNRSLAEKLAAREARKLAKSKGLVGSQAVSVPTSGKSTPMVQAVAERSSTPLVVESGTANGLQQASTQSMSAGALARQQEVAALMARHQEVTDQLSRASSASIAPSSASGEPVMSGALPGPGMVIAETAHVETNGIAHEVAADVKGPTNGKHMGVFSTGEDPKSDDALILRESTETGKTGLGVLEDDDKIGSQASTVGPSQAGLESTALTHLAEVPIDPLSDAVGELTPTLAITGRPDSDAEKDIGVDEPIDEETSGEHDEVHFDGVDTPPSQPDRLAPLIATDAAVGVDQDMTNDDSSSASSTRASDDDEEEEYEPELIKPNQLETTTPPAAINDFGEAQSAVSAISDAVQTVNGETQLDDDVDDDLAPELQPSKEQQIVISDQVRDDYDWSDIY